MNTRARQLLLASLLTIPPLSLASSARAQSADVFVTNTLFSEYRVDNNNGRDDDDNYGIIINRFNLGGAADNLSVNLRADAIYLISPPTPTERFEDTLQLERLSARYNLERVTIIAGDFNKELGRGTVLSIRKTDELALDMALRGGDIIYEPVDDHTLEVFGGRTNQSNIDGVSQFYLEDPNDIIAGGQYTYSGLDLVTFGLYGLYLEPEEDILEEFTDSNQSGGLFLDFPSPTDFMSLYLEGNFQRRSLVGESEDGTGGYGALNVYLGDTTFLLEGLYLDAFEQKGSDNGPIASRIDYNLAPTLERWDQEVLVNRDVIGTRLRIDHDFFDLDLKVHANAMVRIEDPDTDAPLRQLHAFAGVSQRYQGGDSLIEVSGGYRDEEQLGRRVKSSLHQEWNWNQKLVERLSLHSDGRHEFRTLGSEDSGTLEANAYLRGSAFLGLEYAGVGSATYEFGYDTIDPTVRSVFHAGIVGARVSESVKLTLTVGTQRGGLKCVAGVCRDYPAFAGTRAEVVGRF